MTGVEYASRVVYIHTVYACEYYRSPSLFTAHWRPGSDLFSILCQVMRNVNDMFIDQLNDAVINVRVSTTGSIDSILIKF